MLLPPKKKYRHSCFGCKKQVSRRNLVRFTPSVDKTYEWIEAVSKTDLEAQLNLEIVEESPEDWEQIYICRAHFFATDFTGNHRLKPDALPRIEGSLLHQRKLAMGHGDITSPSQERADDASMNMREDKDDCDHLSDEDDSSNESQDIRQDKMPSRSQYFASEKSEAEARKAKAAQFVPRHSFVCKAAAPDDRDPPTLLIASSVSLAQLERIKYYLLTRGIPFEEVPHDWGTSEDPVPAKKSKKECEPKDEPEFPEKDNMDGVSATQLMSKPEFESKEIKQEAPDVDCVVHEVVDRTPAPAVVEAVAPLFEEKPEIVDDAAVASSSKLVMSTPTTVAGPSFNQPVVTQKPRPKYVVLPSKKDHVPALFYGSLACAVDFDYADKELYTWRVMCGLTADPFSEFIRKAYEQLRPAGGRWELVWTRDLPEDICMGCERAFRTSEKSMVPDNISVRSGFDHIRYHARLPCLRGTNFHPSRTEINTKIMTIMRRVGVKYREWLEHVLLLRVAS